MINVAIGLEYDGADFYGWQRQNEVKSVQEHLENALSKVAAHDVEVTCAGRTDRGVHAVLQVVNFNTTSIRDERAWVLGANTNLPNGIRVLWARTVDNEFNSRKSAVSRAYRYIILNHRVRPGLMHKQVTWEYNELDAAKMNEAAQCLIGEHDFSSYRAASCQSKNPVRNLTEISVKRVGELVVLDVKANAFLHHMVRNIAGVLMSIGSGKEDIGFAKRVLEAKDRTKGGVTAPPNGLYLYKVDYPEIYNIPGVVNEPWFLKV